jgi:hypothetical protein
MLSSSAKMQGAVAALGQKLTSAWDLRNVRFTSLDGHAERQH